ncbi:MAG: Gfo/Idh/MocA family oxidoreductase, partial [Longimicrobiales bacterium]
MSLVREPNNIRLAMIGMVEGNGHPYSWSAIINGGFDAERMARCPYPVIPQYLSAQPKGALGIAGARVTHIWCDDPADAERVAGASYIEHIVARPTDVIGHADAVIISTDMGEEHLECAKPFIDAGVPVFVDKPLTDREDHLRQFAEWHRNGHAIMSSSCMRYAAEFAAVRSRLDEVGEVRVVTMSMCKSWDRYGIHALEG